jgi:predicted nucleic acid-binding protein
MLLSEFNVLQYDEKSQEIYQNFRKQRIRIGTQDLRIASIVLANKGILLFTGKYLIFLLEVAKNTFWKTVFF